MNDRYSVTMAEIDTIRGELRKVNDRISSIGPLQDRIVMLENQVAELENNTEASYHNLKANIIDNIANVMKDVTTNKTAIENIIRQGFGKDPLLSQICGKLDKIANVFEQWMKFLTEEANK